MRISTGMIYDSGLASMQSRTGSLLRVQQQLSTGRRILAPSDDPVAAARALEVTQTQAANKAQAETRSNVKSAVGIADAQLQSATDLLTRVRELAVQGGDAALSLLDRKSIALELRQRFDEMLAIANAKDGLGNSLFGGFQVGNKPFAGSVADGVRYLGDDGMRTLQVSSARQMGISQSGNDIFMRIANGNGVFTTATQNEKSVNASHITYEGLSAPLTNPPTPAAGGSFELRFWTDTAGGNAPVPAQQSGSVDLTALAYPYSFGAGDAISIAIDGGAPVPVSLNPPASFASASAIVSTIQTAIGSAGRAMLNAQGELVVTSASSGLTSSVNIANVSGIPLAALMGASVAVPGAAGAAGAATYYDLVDSMGNSLFTGTKSATGGTTNTYTRAYTTNTPFTLDSTIMGFDYGASLLFTGTPSDGDTFSIARTATDISVTEKTITGNAARASIDAGTVSDPLKWSQTANSGDLEVRFWVDAQGTVATPGQVGGSISPALPLVVTAGTADTFSIDVDGTGAQTITLTPGSYATTTAILAEVQTRIDALAAPAVNATANLDANGQLVVTSDASGAGSSIALAEGNGALARVFGVPTATAGTAAAAGRTFYDLVDAATGNSLFTGAASATGAGGSYTREFLSPSTQIDLLGRGGPGQQTFDFGASVTIAGIPAGGDAFTIKSSTAYTGNGHFVTEAKTATRYNTGSGIIGAGDIHDETKWNHPANSRNLEIRFWQDPEDVSADPTIYYDLVDAETEKSLFTDSTSTAGGTNNSFTRVFNPGNAISFNGLSVPHGASTVTDFGISVTINGKPASGDAFKIGASESQSVFETLAKTITLLESGKPVETMGNVQLSNELGAILSSLSRAEDSILSARAVFGSNLSEVDNLDSVGENLNIQYEETLSRLQDLDYAEAITKLTRQQMELQAAQQSFSRISQLSLFDYIR